MADSKKRYRAKKFYGDAERCDALYSGPNTGETVDEWFCSLKRGHHGHHEGWEAHSASCRSACIMWSRDGRLVFKVVHKGNDDGYFRLHFEGIPGPIILVDDVVEEIDSLRKSSCRLFDLDTANMVHFIDKWKSQEKENEE